MIDDSSDDSSGEPKTLLFIVSLAIFGVTFGTITAVKISVAPRVFIMEYIGNKIAEGKNK